MPQFIQALVGIAMSISTSFTHGGKPATLPVVSQLDASVYGSAVSAAATNLDPQNQNGQTSSQSQGGNEHAPDTNKVATDNIKAGIQMPALIPNVALEHSTALQVSGGLLPTPPGHAGGQSNSENAQVSANTNASFGQSTAASARSNSRRP